MFHCPVEVGIPAVIAATLETSGNSYNDFAVDAAVAGGGVLAGSVQVIQRSEMGRRRLLMVGMMMVATVFSSIRDDHGFIVNFRGGAPAWQGGIVPERGGRGGQGRGLLFFFLPLLPSSMMQIVLGIISAPSPHRIRRRF